MISENLILHVISIMHCTKTKSSQSRQTTFTRKKIIPFRLILRNLQTTPISFSRLYIKQQNDGLVQDYSNSIANALELQQSCAKPSKICVNFMRYTKICSKNRQIWFWTCFNRSDTNTWNPPRLLTHCGLMTPYGGRYLGQHGSGNGLLPDGTKPLPEPMSIYHQQGPLAFIWVQFYKRYFSHQSLKLAGKLLS